MINYNLSNQYQLKNLITLLQDYKEHTYSTLANNLKSSCILINNLIAISIKDGLCFEIKKKCLSCNYP